MNFASVQATLNDLPYTFRKTTTPYTQLVDAWSVMLALFTDGVDGTIAQTLPPGTTFLDAVGGWIDVWGLAFNIARLPAESDHLYQARVLQLLSAIIGSAPAIQIWIGLYAPGGSVSENLPAVGYTIRLPSAMTDLQNTQFFGGLQYVRPVGVPISFVAATTGLYLGTIDFAGLDTVQGSYLAGGAAGTASLLPAVQNNALPQIPTLFLTDPTLNPSLA